MSYYNIKVLCTIGVALCGVAALIMAILACILLLGIAWRRYWDSTDTDITVK